MERFVIDATNKRLGRVASEAAHIIMGKNRTDFARNVVPQVSVVVENASKIIMTEKKLAVKRYQSYSGYPGGRKVLSGAEVIAKKGYAELFRRAVHGMLPRNKLRAKMIKHLIVKA